MTTTAQGEGNLTHPHIKIISDITKRKILFAEELIKLSECLAAMQVLQNEINEANSNLESAFLLHRSLEWKLNKANAEIQELKKPVLIHGEPLRCAHEWESVEPDYTGETSRCKKCGIYE